MGPLVNLIEEATRLPSRRCLHPELVELSPELRGQHGLVVRERTHRGWGAGGGWGGGGGWGAGTWGGGGGGGVG